MQRDKKTGRFVAVPKDKPAKKRQATYNKSENMKTDFQPSPQSAQSFRHCRDNDQIILHQLDMLWKAIAILDSRINERLIDESNPGTKLNYLIYGLSY
jgi:hypothetical protein